MRKLVIFVTALSLATGLHAAELRVALAAAATSLDPQFHVVGANSSLARSIFDSLVLQDERQQLQPGLAVAWRPIGDTGWEFELRQGVRFHDGSSFAAEDVAASIRRVKLASQNSPSSFLSYVQDIVEIVVVNDRLIRFRTAAPTPLLPNSLSRISILPRSQETVPTAELNAGKGVIGTGPFRFVSWQRGDHVKLARNTGYWGGPVPWDAVTLRFINNDGARVAAMLAGDVDAIEGIPTPDIARFKADRNLNVVSVPSNRVLYLHMDQDRELSPFAAGPDGKNPLRNVEVRRALSMAINRQALIDRVADGQGTLAEQLVPKGYFGWSPNIRPEPFNPAGARELLKRAGLASGFNLTFHASNDRYPNDAKVAQAIGQMFTRAGINTRIEVVPSAVFFPQATERKYSLIMGGAAVETGEASGVLGPLLATFGPKRGLGNRGRYSNPDFDRALDAALATVNDAQRDRLLQKAMEIGIRDVGVIPLYFMANNWAAKRTLTYPGRTDGYTLPLYFRPAR